MGKHDKQYAEYLDEYWRENYQSPTFREIGKHCNILSTSQVRNMVERVARRRQDQLYYRNNRLSVIVPKWVRDRLKNGHKPVQTD